MDRLIKTAILLGYHLEKDIADGPGPDYWKLVCPKGESVWSQFGKPNWSNQWLFNALAKHMEANYQIELGVL